VETLWGTARLIPSIENARARYDEDVNSFSTGTITNCAREGSYLTSMEA
jgi:hypothetical protein